MRVREDKPHIWRRYARHVSSGKAAFFDRAGIDFVMGRREGIYVWDLDGRRLVDCHCNGGVFNLGHRNPRIIAALQAALEEVDIGNHHFVSEAKALLGEELARISPEPLTRVVFGVSGGEAVDLAIKLARGATGRTTIVSAEGGYHGHTGLALAAGDRRYRDAFAPLAPGFVQVPFNDVGALENSVDENTAAVLLETIPATLGIVIPEPGYLQAVRQACHEAGALLILDEVQTGLGRCGTFWGFEGHDIVPDILVTGKGLSGGLYPISATLYSERLNSFFEENPFIHISTFGGSEVGCLVAHEVLSILQEPAFLKRVQTSAVHFSEELESLRRAYPSVLQGIRQQGLMIGLQLADSNTGPEFSALGFQDGLLSVFANHDPSVVQLLPPLIIDDEGIGEVIASIGRVLARLGSR